MIQTIERCCLPSFKDQISNETNLFVISCLPFDAHDERGIPKNVLLIENLANFIFTLSPNTMALAVPAIVHPQYSLLTVVH